MEGMSHLCRHGCDGYLGCSKKGIHLHGVLLHSHKQGDELRGRTVRYQCTLNHFCNECRVTAAAVEYDPSGVVLLWPPVQYRVAGNTNDTYAYIKLSSSSTLAVSK